MENWYISSLSLPAARVSGPVIYIATSVGVRNLLPQLRRVYSYIHTAGVCVLGSAAKLGQGLE